jgi:hypothetical protein
MFLNSLAIRTARTEQLEQDSQNETGRMGQPERDIQNSISRTGDTEQDYQERTPMQANQDNTAEQLRALELGFQGLCDKGRKKREFTSVFFRPPALFFGFAHANAKARLPGRDSQVRTARKEQPEKDCHLRTVRTGMLGPEGQSRTAGTGQPAQNT